ncbi:MAG: hypothetical protein Q7R97_05485 [Candidatus Daviesbacteria bacterium]|nr:hypothetical protein [Candidatus Daviesbacteria bacterium]
MVEPAFGSQRRQLFFMLELPLYQNPVNYNQFSPLEFLSSFVVIKPEFVWLLVILVGVFFTVVSFVLSYHWKSFGLEMFVMGKAAILYFSVSSVLLVLMVVSLIVYLNSL